MIEQSFLITEQSGIHARPATQLVNKASQFNSELTLTYDGKSVNLKSIMGVMSLGVREGATITIKADGPDEQVALTSLAEVIKVNLGK